MANTTAPSDAATVVDTVANVVAANPPHAINPQQVNPQQVNPQQVNPQQVNSAYDAINFIRKKEGYSSVIYYDSAGLPTIGYGHLLLRGELTKYAAGIDTREAEQLLLKDIEPSRAAVESLVKVPLNQNQFTSLISFVYNIGVGAFRRSTLLRKLNAGDYSGASNEFQRWNKATVNGQKVTIAGLTNRRYSEKKLFLT